MYLYSFKRVGVGALRDYIQILAAFLAEGDDWQSVHADTIATLFLRNAPQNQNLLSKLLGNKQ